MACLLAAVLASIFMVGAAQATAGEHPVRDQVRSQVHWEIERLGIPVNSVKCSRYRGGEFAWIRWDCRVDRLFGSNVVVRAANPDRDGSVNAFYYPRGMGRTGAWYQGCRQAWTRGRCLNLGGRQIRKCMKGWADQKQARIDCRGIVYGIVRLS